MRLQKESVLCVQGDSAEYKMAVKSVIRCQIQSLLQKLASETGEESIVISTNVSAGTYNHLGSHLGREYLEDGDEFVQVVCEKFTSFCAEVQNNEFGADNLSLGNLSSAEKPGTLYFKGLPAQKRKRQYNTLELPDTPPHKRKPQQYLLDEDSNPKLRNTFQTDISPGKGEDSAEATETRQVDKENETPRISWIKVEPKDNDGSYPSLNGIDKISISTREPDYCPTDDPSQTSIVNRPKSLIPLANIFKKYGNNKPIKVESPTKNNQDENKLQEKSILRSLYEQPLHNAEDSSHGEDIGNSTANGQTTAPSLSLPVTINEESCMASSSENLVLSGYYDSDSYPTYRHKQKHPFNNQILKKPKVQEKKMILPDSLSDGAGIDAHLRTFQSGGRLVYACDVCNRELSHLTSYRRHMKLHTMERPHKCPVCSKGFIRKYHCIDHLNKHHKGVGFDPDSLKLTGVIDPKVETQEISTALSSQTSEPDEYNYTLDQSLVESSENELSLNASQLDQSASAMLSELAKSAAKSQMSILNQSGSSENALENDLVHDENSFSTCQILQPGNGDCHEINQQPEDSGLAFQHSTDVSSFSYQSDNTKNHDVKIDEKSGLPEEESNSEVIGNLSENSAEMRKNEVSEGIKAIVEHLKTSSRNKRKRVPPKSITTDMVN